MASKRTPPPASPPWQPTAWTQRILLLILLASYVVLACQQVSFRGSASDLARHLRDGELILAGETDVLHKNYYSYTHPDAPFPNHHWLTSVIYYGISNIAGLAGLNAAYIALGLCAFLLHFRIAAREAGFPTAFAIAILMLPLLTVRFGIRPEVFTLLFLAIFLTALWNVHREQLGPRWLWLLPLLEALWVNFHPGFILGPILIAAFAAPALLARSPRAPMLTLVFAASLVATLANPNGFDGAIFPLTVAGNYAMPVRENLSLFQLRDLWISQLIAIVVMLFAAGVLWTWRRRAALPNTQNDWPVLLFSAFLAAMSVAFFRVYIFMGAFVLVSAALLIRSLRSSGLRWLQPTPTTLLAILLAGTIHAALVRRPWTDFGLDLDPRDAVLARFLQDNSISGRVFNGYVTGPYLIHFLPGQPVFVDNRPEAYPAEFFRDEYLPALRDESVWARLMTRYDFDFICFVRFDEEESRFLLRRIRDPQWAAVYAGDQMLLVRRKPEFQALIERHGLRF